MRIIQKFKKRDLCILGSYSDNLQRKKYHKYKDITYPIGGKLALSNISVLTQCQKPRILSVSDSYFCAFNSVDHVRY